MERKAERNQEIMKMYKLGWVSTALADYFDISRQRVEAILTENGVSLRRRWGQNGSSS